MEKFKCFRQLLNAHKLLFVLASLIYAPALLSCEFLYPVAVTKKNNKTQVYVLHQKSINNIELLIWDPETKICSNGLLSSYTPAALKILPNGDGFSFIDDGRIRIKNFDKRSPKSIDIYEPLYDISQINWIDEHNFYLSAKKNNKFCIFHVHENGLIKPILQDMQYEQDEGASLQNSELINLELPNHGLKGQDLAGQGLISYDFMYPQKVGDSLFFIERITHNGEYKKEPVSYKIIKTVYPDLCKQVSDLTDSIENSQDFEVKSKIIQEFTDNCTAQELAKKNCQCLVDFKDKPIAFLSMISETEGFFLKHPENVCKHDKVVVFECFYIKNTDIDSCKINSCSHKSFCSKGWVCEKIFSFAIPTYLILEVPDSCLYESILPLLPKYYNNKIYFVDFDIEKQSLGLVSYNLLNDFSERLFTKEFSPQLLFAPIFLEDKIICGGKIDYTESCLVKIWIGDSGSVCIDLPKILI